MIRDILDYSKLYEVNVGFLFLDQEKAFDRVDHGFLYDTMSAFGFGDGFISWIKLLYMNASCILKIGGGLSKPISLLKGIRQGCPLSGQLYALAVEPLLCILRKELSGLNIDGNGNAFKLTAYADDITVIVKDQRDIDVVIYSISLYERASSAKLNWSKTEAFWCNDKDKYYHVNAKPVIPGNVKWEKDGFKFLGIFLGSEVHQRKNWEGVKDKICNRLSKWNWILPQLSYRGRVLVVNNLAASILWHKLIVLNPPDELIREIQRVLVNFFWNGQHWLRESVLYLQLSEGGQGLMDIKSKVAAFRLQIVQRLLYNQPQNWTKIACALLKRVGRMNLDRHLFLMNLKEVDFNGLSSFYASVLNAWQIFIVKRELSEVTHEWVLEEPLIFNPLLSSVMLQAKGVCASLVKAGICQICHLRSRDKWISAEKLASKMGIHSVRTVEKLLVEIQESFTIIPLQAERVENVFPSIRVGVNVGDWQEVDGRLLSFTTPEIGLFDTISKKSLYLVCVKYFNIRKLQDLPETKWTNFVESGASPKGCWRTLYKKPIEKRSGDLQWRISHWILATNRYKVHLNSLQEECLFCGLPETVFHIFIGCTRLLGILDVLKDLSHNFGFIFTNRVFIFGPKYSASNKSKIVLINVLFGNAKMPIWLTRKRKMQFNSDTDPLTMFRALVKSRLVMEYKYYELVNDTDSFFYVWGVGNILCKPNEEGGCNVLL
uniref:Reverse transcriptase domain-containing protein n=1 Tax=Hucho hucho TaxID=62062 RepID=A0A4W5P160_9TELE